MNLAMNSDFKELLLQQASKVIVEDIAKSVISSPELFDDIYNLTFDKDKKIAWRSLWVCNKISESHPSFFADRYDELINRAMNAEDPSIMRLTLNIILHLHQPKNINVPFLDFCIENMTALDKTSACQAVCMKLAYKMCRYDQPELLYEIKTYIENMDEAYYNAAAICTKNNILKNINKNR